jgi:hypothetical protein
MLFYVAKAGEQSVINEAQRRFGLHIGGNSLHPNIRGSVYAIVARYGDETTHNELLKVSNNTHFDERDRCFSSVD